MVIFGLKHFDCVSLEWLKKKLSTADEVVRSTKVWLW